MFIEINFKIAKRLFKKAKNKDTSNLEGANESLAMIEEATKALERARYVQAEYDYDEYEE